MAVPKAYRLRKSAEFAQVRAKGESFHFPGFVAQACWRTPSSSLTAMPRLGVIASRRVGNAVKRNRGKRLLRYLFHLHNSQFPPNCDLVCILRQRFDTLSFAELESSFHRLAQRLKRNGPPRKNQLNGQTERPEGSTAPDKSSTST